MATAKKKGTIILQRVYPATMKELHKTAMDTKKKTTVAVAKAPSKSKTVAKKATSKKSSMYA